MTIKERKLILHFLEMLYAEIENRKVNEIDSVFTNLLSRKQLIEIIVWLYDGVYDKSSLASLEDDKLLELINTNGSVVAYFIEQWKSNISAVPKLSQSEVDDFFERMPISIHYLRDKPVDEWDDYDVSNYYAILYKHGKTRRVFAIYTSEVKEEDKYIVSTQPSFFFDTKEEAEAELGRCLAEENFNEGDLQILSLWKIE